MPPKTQEIRHFFVYGTLCRGQCRANLWPARPLRITPAWTTGQLYGRADYPAMRPGTDRVNGECWEFDAAEMPLVIRTLDEIEGTNQPGERNLYDRVVTQVRLLEGSETLIPAFGYHYATDPLADGFHRIVPIGAESGVRWPGHSNQ
ncbi:gamma-glutamylcyclotransferase family protein [Neorhodopirellula pilleata]|uniref:AIG2-like family protein n=1 Tax=Neorhodopirellula pilleata TaxID=2714738 RepID=A0A5C5ZZN6_9BACT|nr:gamma-glutamylcyclotransferase family protein [Neorhodopirellula pilleata]TWT92585.1 AIG2-like family protein [Neorhodopirellula pilleata]